MIRRGALHMLASAFLFAGVAVLVKLSARTMPDGMIVFFRNAGSLAALLPFVLAPRAGSLKTARPVDHFLRALVGLASMYFCFYALARMPMGDAMLLSYTSPLFMPWLAALWTKEPPSRGALPAALLGFLGVALVMKPGLGLFSPAALAAVGAGFLGAAAQVGVRDLTRTEPVGRIVFYFSAVSTGVSALALPWCWKTPASAEWLLLIGTGMVASVAQMFLTRAYRQAPASLVGPFIYSAVVFSAAWDWLLWRQRPDVLSLAGAALIFCAGALILRRSPPDSAPLAQR